jgi:hypothetical protein
MPSCAMCYPVANMLCAHSRTRAAQEGQARGACAGTGSGEDAGSLLVSPLPAVSLDPLAVFVPRYFLAPLLYN